MAAGLGKNIPDKWRSGRKWANDRQGTPAPGLSWGRALSRVKGTLSSAPRPRAGGSGPPHTPRPRAEGSGPPYTPRSDQNKGDSAGAPLAALATSPPGQAGSGRPLDLVEFHRAEHINSLGEQFLDIAQQVGVHRGTGKGVKSNQHACTSVLPWPSPLPEGRPGSVAGRIAALLPGAAVNREGSLAGVAALGLANTLFVQEPHLVVREEVLRGGRTQGPTATMSMTSGA